jgi:hypothetical protein
MAGHSEAELAVPTADEAVEPANRQVKIIVSNKSVLEFIGSEEAWKVSA